MGCFCRKTRALGYGRVWGRSCLVPGTPAGPYTALSGYQSQCLLAAQGLSAFHCRCSEAFTPRDRSSFSCGWFRSGTGRLCTELQRKDSDCVLCHFQVYGQHESARSGLEQLRQESSRQGHALATLCEEKEELVREKAVLEVRLAAMERDRQGLSEQLAEAR